MGAFLLGLDDAARWSEWLRYCSRFDIYHTPEYHRAIAVNEQGEPLLLVYEENGKVAAFPFLKREIRRVQGLEKEEGYDAISCYGYPGVLSNVAENDRESKSFRMKFQTAVINLFSEMGLISFFGRQNPLISTGWLWEGIASVTRLGETVAIRLDQTEEQQLKEMSKGHRYDIRKAGRDGVRVWEDFEFEELSKFVEIYEETMDEVGAQSSYYFPMEYYRSLRKHLGAGIRLFFAERDGKIISASLFLVSRDIAQYHLAGTPRRYLRYSGGKMILDHLRRTLSADGFQWLHLGGGVGAHSDALFRFKAGFSRWRLPYEIVCCIVDKERYDRLVALRSAYLHENGGSGVGGGFFPGYRSESNWEVEDSG